MNLEQYIDQVAIGGKPLQKPEERFGIHYACGVKKSGILTLYVGGRKYARNKCGGGYERKELMKKMLRRVGQTNKEMYFIWLPDIN